jgi:hypothetical protein
MSGEREPPNDPSSPFKKMEKGVKVNPKLGGQWNVLKLGGQWNVPKLGGQSKEKEKFLLLGGQWNVPLFFGQWNVKEKPFSPLPIFPPTNLFKPSIFSFDLEVLPYHGFRLLLTPFFHFPRSINYDYASRCNKSFTPSLSI